MTRSLNEHHIDCVPKGDNPKGLLRRLYYNSLKNTGDKQHIRAQYYLCDGCGMLIKMKQEELKQ